MTTIKNTLKTTLLHSNLVKETITKEINFSNDTYRIEVEELYYYEGCNDTFKVYSIYINNNFDNAYIRLPKALREFFNI